MDGVLIEAKDWHYEALNRALRLFGTEISKYDHLTTFDGLPTKVKLEMLSKERGFPKGLHGFVNDMKQIYTTNLVHQLCKPLFVHQFALARLKREGYQTAVCSNSIRSTVELMMEKSALAEFLDKQFSADDVKKAKPAPDIYLAAMEHFKAKPEECLILEDNANGIKAAQDSGGHVLVIKEVEDVNYPNIRDAITKIEQTSQKGMTL